MGNAGRECVAAPFGQDVTIFHESSFRQNSGNRFYQDTQTLGRYGEDVIAILSGDSIIGLGPVKWFKENRHTISNISNQTPNGGQYKRDKEDEGEDLLDDEDI